MYPLGESPRETGFLFSGDYGNLMKGWAHSQGACTGGRLFHGHSREVPFREDFRQRLNVLEYYGVRDVFPAFYMCP